MSRFKFSTKKEKLSFFNISHDDLKNSAFSGAHIELFSNKEITVDGCYGVIDYTSDYIKLKLKKGSLIITGNSFYIYLFENKIITVKGTLQNLEFCI